MRILLIFLTMLFLLHDTLWGIQLTETQRLTKADSRGGVLLVNNTLFIADHHDGLWKSDTQGTTYGKTTGSDKALYDLWLDENTHIVGVGPDGLFFYDLNGNLLQSTNIAKGHSLYAQNGYAYVALDSGGIAIVDIHDINNPILKNTILTGENFSAIRGNNLFGDLQNSGPANLLYITATDGKLYLFEDDQNGTLTFLNDLALFSANEARRVFVADNGYCYINSNQGELAIVSTDLNKKTMSLKGSWSSSEAHGAGSNAPAAGGVSLITVDSKYYAFITVSDNADKGFLYLLDVTRPASINLEATFDDTATGNYGFSDLWVDGKSVYVSSHDGTLFLTHDVISNTGGICTGVFPGALSSTYDEIQINTDTKIYGTTNHTLVTKTLTTSSGVECDSAPCQKSGTLADTMNIDLQLGDGSDGDQILSDNQSLTISSDKAYSKFQTGKTNTITINGDITIKSQSDFYINSDSKININGNVVIYADKFDSNQQGVFDINGSLTIFVNTFYLNSGNKVQNIPNPQDFVVFAESIVDINSQVDFKGLFYSAEQLQVNDHTIITGAMTGGYIDVNNDSVINYDPNAVNSYCGSGELHTISGTIFEDISGDAFADGDSGIGDASGDQQSKHGTTLYLYKDNGNNLLDSNDTLTATANTDTLGNGRYSFKNISAGRYYVVVDSTTIPPEHTLKPTSDLSHIWAEQTWGPKGGLCDDGNGTTVTLSSAGTCYGGRRAGISDDPSSPATAEHIAVIDLSSSDVTDVDFGFSFCVVTHTKDNDDDPANPKSAQGSLRQFIQNANAISGRDRMRFVPTEAPNSGNWWTITPQTALPTLSDNDIVIDGTAFGFDGSVRDENPGTAGSGGTPLGTGSDGVIGTGDEPKLDAFYKKELEIDAAHQFPYLFKIATNGISGVSIINLALIGSRDDTDTTDLNADILVSDGADNIEIADNFIGLHADGSIPSGSSSSDAYGIVLIQDSNAITNFHIHHNYIGYVGGGGIWVTGHAVSHGQISQNEVIHSHRLTAWLADGIAAENGAEYITIYQNYAHDNNGPGFEGWEAKGHIVWRDNTSSHNGFNPDANPNDMEEKYGLRAMGSDNTIEHNLIVDNAGPGITITNYEDSNNAGLRTRISQNSFRNNGSIAIDLDQTHGGNGDNALGDGITANNGTKDATLQNEDMDYPIFTFANLVGNTLTLNGYIGTAPDQSIFANAKVEVYKAIDDGDGNGEGSTYLGSCTADNSGNFFNCRITTTAIAAGDPITATATDTAGNTSEFGPNKQVVGSVPYTCDANAYIFYSDTLDQPTQVNEIDLLNATQTQLSSDIYPVNINGIGYSVVNNMIWGYDTINHLVTRTDSNLQTVAYTIDGLDPYTFHIGDVSTDGILYLTSAYLKTKDGVESDGILRLYRVDVNPSSPTYLQKLSEVPLDDTSLYAADFAFHPNENKIYLVERFSGHIFKIDPSNGHVTDIGDIGLGDNVDSHVQFFDKNGYFYFFKDDIFYRCDLTDPNHPDPKAVKFIDMPLPKNGDGARCAYADMGDKTIIQIADASLYEGDSGTKSIAFTIVSDRNITASGGLTLNYSTSDGSALSGSDYIAASGTITIPQGQSAVTLTLPIINGDLAIESDEDFFVTLTSPDANFLDDTAHAVILNDDYNITINAVNTGSPFLDGNLTTQIVNQPFTVTLGAYNETLGSSVSDMNITQIDLVDPLGNLYAHLFSGNLLTDADGTAVVSLNISKAYKAAKLKISGSYMERVYSGRSGDDFAIRPKRFDMQIPQQNIAGVPFTISLSALDANDAPATDYNETITHSFNLDYTEQKKSSCHTGTLNLGTIAFTDGNATRTTHYSETGLLDFNLSEIPGHEFAVVDADDTPDAQRLITPVTATDINFTIDHFDITGLDLIDGSTSFTYYAAPADMQQMAARIVLTLTAKNAQGTTTQNYQNGCYSKDVMLAVHFDTNSTPTQHNILAWQEDGDPSHAQNSALSFNGSVTDQSFIYDIPAHRFVAGEHNSSIKINFNRNYTLPKEPMRFTLTQVDAVNGDNRSGSVTESHMGDFYYGRQHASDYMVVGNRLDAKIFYELYCDQCDRKGLFTLADQPESADQVRWYRISNYHDGVSGFTAVTGTYHHIPVTLSTSSSAITSIMALGAETNALDNITFSVPKEDLPFKDRIRYLPKPWLIYKKFPATDLRHTFDIDLSILPNDWAGRGETGYTVDLNVSGRKGGMKLDW